jgi:hypothetical protein
LFKHSYKFIGSRAEQRNKGGARGNIKCRVTPLLLIKVEHTKKKKKKKKKEGAQL